jgi:hypothetical protein
LTVSEHVEKREVLARVQGRWWEQGAVGQRPSGGESARYGVLCHIQWLMRQTIAASTLSSESHRIISNLLRRLLRTNSSWMVIRHEHTNGGYVRPFTVVGI